MPAVTRRQYKGAAAQTTLVNALAPGDTTATIAANTGWPSAAQPFYVVFSPGTTAEEKCLVTISGTTLTLTRAQDDTTAQSHASGATVYPVFTADDADEANKLASTLTTRGDLLTMGSGPDFARIAIGSANTVLKSDGTDASWGSVTSAMIADGTIVNADISSTAAVDASKLANLPINDRTASYTLVVGDRNKRVVMNVASANTVTVNDSVFSAGDTVLIANKGAGVSTVTAGSGVTINTLGSLALSQYGSGSLVALSASSFIFFPSAGAIKVTNVDEFTSTGTWTVPAGVTYAVAHIRGAGGGAGKTGAGTGGSSSVAFAGGTATANGGNAVNFDGPNAITTSAGATNSGEGALFVAADTNGRSSGGRAGDGAYIVHGAAVTPAASITVTVGTGGTAGTDGSAGGSGYVWIEYEI